MASRKATSSVSEPRAKGVRGGKKGGADRSKERPAQKPSQVPAVTIGDKFGRLTVIAPAVRPRHLKARGRWWHCRCDCGDQTVLAVSQSALRSGNTRSCGCLQREGAANRSRTHGLHKSREYRAWNNMISRCHCPNWPKYHDYGGRGIRVCRRWRKSFQDFYADMGPCPPGMTLERIGNDKGYSPENCKWATYAEQLRNTRQTRFVTFKGETMCIADWAMRLGIRHGVIWHRLKIGLPVAEVLSPILKSGKNKTYRKGFEDFI